MRPKRLLPAALGWNGLVLLCTALLVRVGFESNDDLTLAAFVDGQMAVPTAHIPYLNIVLAALLKGVYAVLGQGAAWHTFGQYALLLAGFTALTLVLCERLGLLPGLLASSVVLLFFGVDAYSVISYTKTAAVCTVGGLALLFHAQEQGRRPGAAIFGALLCLFGFSLRQMEFLPCFGILGAGLGLRWLQTRRAAPGTAKEKGRELLRFVLPFGAVLLLCALLYGINEAAWSSARWASYHRFDAVRVAYSDYGRPEYAAMPEEYEALGLSESDVRLLYEGNYFDPEVFSAETMQAISDARDRRFPPLSWGECLGVFLDTCVRGFFRTLPAWGLLLLSALWLACGGHELRDWLAAAGALALFGIAYLYLIRRGRYLVGRVDMGLLLALAAALGYTLRREKLRAERTLAALLLALSLLTSCYLTRDSFRRPENAPDQEARAAVEMLLADSGHVYLAKLDTVSDRIYSPFEPAGRGYWDKIVLLGGFDCNHPAILDNLARYGVENPYRDCIGNERVRLIEDDVELTLRYLREHYEPSAEAERIEPLSRETGLNIYRIVKGGGT